jgi:hypothetical protein
VAVSALASAAGLWAGIGNVAAVVVAAAGDIVAADTAAVVGAEMDSREDSEDGGGQDE